jgi:hypothetical protein
MGDLDAAQIVWVGFPSSQGVARGIMRDCYKINLATEVTEKKQSFIIENHHKIIYYRSGGKKWPK